MGNVKDLDWTRGMTVHQLIDSLGSVGFQGAELARASDLIVKMKRSSARMFFTFTSNMMTSGLRGLFSQLIRVGMVDVIVTTVGGLEEDIMKATGERFSLGTFSEDDVALYEEGVNRIGNIYVTNESYARFEDTVRPMLEKLYAQKARWSVSEMLAELGGMLDDEHSVLYQAWKHGVPVFCPAITDGALGFHLFMFQEKHPDFVVDVVKDFKHILVSTSQDDVKGLVSLGGSVSKHHAILACLLNGGLDYAVYMTTASQTSGSMSGATTREAKSWGKVKDDSDAVTVKGDVTITFPLAMGRALEILEEDGAVSLGSRGAGDAGDASSSRSGDEAAGE